MAKPFIFRCPTTGQNVQSYSERDEPPPSGQRQYEGMMCLACGQLHIVNPATGRLMSEEIDGSAVAGQSVGPIRPLSACLAPASPSPGSSREPENQTKYRAFMLKR